MRYELLEDLFDDDNNGLIYGINWLDEDDNVVECEWFKTIGKRSNAITRQQIFELSKDELYGLVMTYANYVTLLSSEEGTEPACLEEFYENDYKEILKKD
jgi:hypothetical protein